MAIKIERFKTLTWTNEQDKCLGKYATIVHGAFGGCDVPELMTMEATIDKLKFLYPDLDFDSVKLTNIYLSEISEIWQNK